jgi:hypothetical protein
MELWLWIIGVVAVIVLAVALDGLKPILGASLACRTSTRRLATTKVALSGRTGGGLTYGLRPLRDCPVSDASRWARRVRLAGRATASTEPPTPVGPLNGKPEGAVANRPAGRESPVTRSGS